MNAIDINMLTHEEKAAVVCLYYAQLKKVDERYKKCHVNLRLIAEKYNFKYSTLKKQ